MRASFLLRRGAPSDEDGMIADPHNSDKVLTFRRHRIVWACLALVLSYTLAPLGSFAPSLIKSRGNAYELGDILGDFFASISMESHLAVHNASAALSAYNRTTLQSHYEAILEEYNRFRSNHTIPSFGDLDPVQRNRGHWKTLWLRLYGVESCVANEYFPITMAAVKASGLPAVSIMLSHLAPGQSLAAHRGPTRAVLRYHLGISIPKNATTPAHLSIWPCDSTACPRQRLVWREGEAMYFDDSFLHAAVNPTNEERLILWLDLKRHDLKGWRERLLSEAIFAAIQWFPPPSVLTNILRTNQLCSS